MDGRVGQIGERLLVDHGTSPAGGTAAHRRKFFVVEPPGDILERGLERRHQQLVVVDPRVNSELHAWVMGRNDLRDGFRRLKSPDGFLDKREDVSQRPFADGLGPDEEFTKVRVLAEIKLAQRRHAVGLIVIDPMEVE